MRIAKFYGVTPDQLLRGKHFWIEAAKCVIGADNDSYEQRQARRQKG